MKLHVAISLPEGYSAECKNGKLVIAKGDKSISREYPRSRMAIELKNNSVDISVANIKFRPLVGTFVAHVKNMIAGLNEPFVYKLKVCSTHFPMSAKLDGNRFLVQNFLGEKSPRIINVPKGVDVKVQGEIITVSSYDIELAGRTASQMENSTRLCNKDRRVFQDGVYITEKARKKV